MKFDKRQILLLLERFNIVAKEAYSNPTQHTIDISNDGFDQISIIISLVSKGVCLRIAYGCGVIYAYLDGPAGRVEGQYEVSSWFILRLFNKPYRKWIAIAFQADVYLRETKNKEEAEKNKEEAEKFNRVIHSTYPDELNRILLGDNDVK